MRWVIPIAMALLFAYYLLWLFVKLRRLTKTKARLFHARAARQTKHLPAMRTGTSRRRKE